MKFSDEEIILALESLGVPWQQHFVLNGGLIVFSDAGGRMFIHVIENDDLHASTKRFLTRHGLVRNEGHEI